MPVFSASSGRTVVASATRRSTVPAGGGCTFSSLMQRADSGERRMTTRRLGEVRRSRKRGGALAWLCGTPKGYVANPLSQQRPRAWRTTNDVASGRPALNTHSALGVAAWESVERESRATEKARTAPNALGGARHRRGGGAVTRHEAGRAAQGSHESGGRAVTPGHAPKHTSSPRLGLENQHSSCVAPGHGHSTRCGSW